MHVHARRRHARRVGDRARSPGPDGSAHASAARSRSSPSRSQPRPRSTATRAPAAPRSSRSPRASPGPLDNTVHGLVGVDAGRDSVTTGAYDIDNPVADARHEGVPRRRPGRARRPPGSRSTPADDAADLDLFVYKSGEFVDLSASGAADEQVTLIDPAEGHVRRVRQRLRDPGGSTVLRDQQLRRATGGSAGNATVTPNPACGHRRRAGDAHRELDGSRYDEAVVRRDQLRRDGGSDPVLREPTRRGVTDALDVDHGTAGGARHRPFRVSVRRVVALSARG